MDSKTNNALICNECIGEEYLTDSLAEINDVQKCTYCQSENPAILLEELSDKVHDVIRYFYLHAIEEYPWLPEYESIFMGDDVELIVGEMLLVEPEIASDIVKTLSKKHWKDAAIGGEPDPYGNEVSYVRRQVYDESFVSDWYEFQKEIRARGRFFNERACDLLDRIFANLETLQNYADREFIVDLDGQSGHAFWRARNVKTRVAAEKLVNSPHLKIGPPPTQHANPGRMNAQGISVFYGAEDLETCVSEVRAPVGGYVVAAKFELTKSVRLLDFTGFTDLTVEGSVFDEHFVGLEADAAFFKRLTNEISRPVMRGDELEEYLVTQVVAEYLASRKNPRFDGVLFPSTQTGTSGRNVVLFNHAAGLVPYEIEKGTEIETHVVPELDYVDESTHPQTTGKFGISVVEWSPNQQQRDKIKREAEKGWWFDVEPEYTPGAVTEDRATLALDLETLTLLRVNRMQPCWSSSKVSYVKMERPLAQ